MALQVVPVACFSHFDVGLLGKGMRRECIAQCRHIDRDVRSRRAVHHYHMKHVDSARELLETREVLGQRGEWIRDTWIIQRDAAVRIH